MNRTHIISIVILSLISCYTGFGATNKSGIISGHEVWSGTINIVGDIVIGDNSSVTINPGTYISIQGHFGITVNKNGTIKALGNRNDSILFLPADKQSGWNGFIFSDLSTQADSSIFDYCRIQYCNKTSYFEKGSAFLITSFNNLRISNSKIANCRNNNTSGGGIYADSSNIVIKNSNISNNYSGFGGGVYFLNSNPVIENSTFDHNICYWDGGAMYFLKSNPGISGCVVSNNYIGSTGGEAIYFEESVGEVINSRIINNRNVGIRCYHANITIINSVIANNEGNSVGGIYLVNSHPSIINSTIVNNSGSNTGGIYCYFYSKPKISNSIIWNNFGASKEIGLGEYTPVISNCNIQDGNDLKIPASDYLNCINKNPKFSIPSVGIGNSPDALLADWSLKSCSPCINKGDNNLVPAEIVTDNSGLTRIFDSLVDIGAFESHVIEPYTAQRKIIYLKAGASGDGTSWQNASGSLQNAINRPLECLEGIDIWVASGTYYPDTLNLTDKRTATFLLNNNIRIFGGFKGDETDLEQRNRELNQTILSGNIGDRNSFIDDVNSVITAYYTDTTAVLDGLTILGGYSYTSGGGISFYYSDAIIQNVIVRDNRANDKGGAIYLDHSNPYIYNSLFYSNAAGSWGGGAYFYYSHPVLLNCRIINNQVDYGFAGGGLYLSYSNPELINSIVANNTAGSSGNGGGIYCQSSNPRIINCVIANNRTSDKGGGIFIYSESRPVIYNSIFWNNQDKAGINHFSGYSGVNISIKNSMIQGGNRYFIPGQDYQNNIDAEPRFNNPSKISGISNDALQSDWSISSCSPLIDAGNTALLPAIYNNDLNGNIRVYNSRIDIGASEFQGSKGEVLDTRVIYVREGANGNGGSWEDAMGNLQEAISLPVGCYTTNEIWVTNGTYKPDTSGLSDKKLATFRMLNHVKLYGGFSGDETTRETRNFAENETILSGDIGIPEVKDDNCMHVVTFDKTDTTSTLDGFCIEKGNAMYTTFYDDGGGIYCLYSNLCLANNTIRNNYADYRGGGIYIYQSNAILKNMIIHDNLAESNVGGLMAENSAVILSNSKIYNNEGGFTGGIGLSSSHGEIFDCLIFNNLGEEAGGISSSYSNYIIANTSILNNRSYYSYAGDLRLYSDTVLILNSLLWNNTNPISQDKEVGRNLNLTIRNSDIQFGTDIELPRNKYINNIDSDPLFKNPVKIIGPSENVQFADWSLHKCSPCMNKGFNDSRYILSPSDVSGYPRIYNDTIDIGALEVQSRRFNAPADLLLSNATIDENYITNTSIGKFATKDSDSEQFIYTFSKSEDAWNWDSSYFNIGGDSLYSGYDLNNAGRSAFTVTIKVEDEAGCELDKPFTITLKRTTDIESTITNIGIKVYPNPTSGLINLSIEGSSQNQIRVRIYNSSGSLCMEQKLKSGDTSLDLSHLNKGTYILKIDQGVKSYTESITLE